MKKLRFILAFTLITLFFIQCKDPSGFSQWKGPNRDGIYPETNLLKEWPEKGPELLWEFNELGLGHSSPVATDDRIYASGTIDSTTFIFSFDYEGNLLWKKPLGLEWVKSFPGIRSTPLIYYDKGYLLTGRGILYCFSSLNGEIIWIRDLFNEFDGVNIMHGITENLLIDDNKLYCTPGGKENNLIALDPNTGELIWSCKGNGDESAYCSPIVINHNGQKYIITCTANAAIAINADNGELAWKFGFDYEWKVHGNTPIYNDREVFVVDGFESGNYKLRIAEDGQSVQEVWKDTLLEDNIGDHVLMDGRLFGGCRFYDDSWVCLDWKTGKKIYAQSSWGPGSIISADGMLYCYGFNGEFGLVKPTPEGFELVSQFQVKGKKKDHWAYPIIKKGKLFIRYANNLLAYSIADN
ncbi:PQQ-binding-like beta-propeller repeat protein [Bacteroidota bacterium]